MCAAMPLCAAFMFLSVPKTPSLSAVKATSSPLEDVAKPQKESGNS